MEQGQIDILQCHKNIEYAINLIKSNWQDITNYDLKKVKDIWQDFICDNYIEKVKNNNITINKIIRELEKIECFYNN